MTPAAGDALGRLVHVEQVMGMPVSIHVRGPAARSDPDVDDAVRRAVAELHAVDALFSTYRADSAVSRIRRGELDLARAPAEVREVARLCEAARDRTEGWFSGWLPDGPQGPRLFDPTGLVKGWAVERVCRRLSGELPAHDVLVDAGGDVALGLPPHRHPAVVGRHRGPAGPSPPPRHPRAAVRWRRDVGRRGPWRARPRSPDR